MYVCLLYLKFSDPLPETNLFFIWPNGTVMVVYPIASCFSYRNAVIIQVRYLALS